MGSAEFVARQRGDTVLPTQFSKSYNITLSPLPCHSHMSPDQRQAEYRRIVAEIQAAAEEENLTRNRKPMGVEAILAQDPHSGPDSTDRSPAPFVHASDEETEGAFRDQYRAFVDAFRAGVQRSRERARALADLFPLWSFPPALPFNAPA